jgi:hypothetical protein
MPPEIKPITVFGQNCRSSALFYPPIAAVDKVRLYWQVFKV